MSVIVGAYYKTKKSGLMCRVDEIKEGRVYYTWLNEYGGSSNLEESRFIKTYSVKLLPLEQLL